MGIRGARVHVIVDTEATAYGILITLESKRYLE